MLKKNEDINKSIYFLNKEFNEQQFKNHLEKYTKDKFLSDLKKVCRPIKKTDKRKSSSQKT